MMYHQVPHYNSLWSCTCFQTKPSIRRSWPYIPIVPNYIPIVYTIGTSCLLYLLDIRDHRDITNGIIPMRSHFIPIIPNSCPSISSFLLRITWRCSSSTTLLEGRFQTLMCRHVYIYIYIHIYIYTYVYIYIHIYIYK